MWISYSSTLSNSQEFYTIKSVSLVTSPQLMISSYNRQFQKETHSAHTHTHIIAEILHYLSRLVYNGVMLVSVSDTALEVNLLRYENKEMGVRSISEGILSIPC